MPITSIEIENFTVFESLNIEFGEGINILVGENGTGKTHLLKLLYFFTHNFETNLFLDFRYMFLDDFAKVIRNHKGKSKILCLIDGEKKEIIINEPAKFGNSTGNSALFGHSAVNVVCDAVFIPAKEMLSHSKGFLALERERQIPFDKTLIDIVAKAQLGETREISDFQSRLLKSIFKVIDGEVIYENDAFYIKKENGIKVEFSMEAEGLRKFGLFWKLIRNGLIKKDTIVFWDEPEANINPQLIPTLVDIILELQRNGVQIFIATHEYNLAKYFEVYRKNEDRVQYHSLFKTENGVSTKMALRYRDIYNNPIEEANEKLYNEILEKAAEEIENEH